MRVETYFNLHKKCLSYRPSGGKVQHAHTILLNNVRFAVQPAGRAKVVREKKKNVHAFVRGEVAFVRPTLEDDCGDITVGTMERHGYRPVTYNPYKYETFVFTDTGEPVHEARQVAIIGRQLWVTA